MQTKSKKIVISAMISAIYVFLTFCFQNISFFAFQIRISEAICPLVIFDKNYIIAISIGCFISNLIMGNIYDAIFGTMATFIGLIFTYKLKNKNFYIASAPIIISNTLIVPFILKYAYSLEKFSFVYLFFTIFIGETISIYILGIIFCKLYKKYVYKKF